MMNFGSHLEVRATCSEALQAVADLEADTTPSAWCLTHYENAYAAGNDIWSLYHDDALLGAVVVRSVVNEAEILNCFIGKRWQGQGFATFLLRWLLSRLAHNGVDQCFLEVRKSNAPAQALYGRLCFEVVGNRRGYYPPLYPGTDAAREDAIVMVCKHLTSAFTHPAKQQ